MSFRLVPNSVTLDDLERHYSPNRSVISPNLVAFGADYVKVVEDTPIYFLQRKCRPKNLVFNDISVICIRVTSESIGCQTPPLCITRTKGGRERTTKVCQRTKR